MQPAVTPAFKQSELPIAGGVLGQPIKLVVDELIIAKRTGNRREVYLKSLQHYLDRFSAGIGVEHIQGVTPAMMEAWLKNFKSAYSRQTWLNRVSTLFSFAVRRGYIEFNPCERVERVTIDHKPPTILTVEQSKKILAACPTVCRPWLILAMFTGIRPDGELMKLNWERICLDTATVKIDFPKVRSHRRIVPLDPIAVSLLRQHPIKTGMVAPSSSTVRRFKRKIRALLGFDRLPTDILRHTAASYLLAKHNGNAALVAGWMGNSVKILMSHYHDPVTKAEADKFFSV